MRSQGMSERLAAWRTMRGHLRETQDSRLKTRELRIALAAVLGTVAIGITRPIITWRASVSGQQAASRAGRGAADLTELRSVLDRSLADLVAYEDAIGTYLLRKQADLLGPTDIDRRKGPARVAAEVLAAHKVVERRSQDVQADDARLE